jgi:cell division protein FtsI/penicillin-binding protein 2
MVGAAVVVGVNVLGRPGNDDDVVRQTTKSYLKAWEEQRWAAMAALARRPPDNFTAVHEETAENLAITKTRFQHGRLRRERGTATVPFSATLTLRGLGEWQYDNELQLVKADEEWRVHWSPSVIHPDLRPGLALRRTRERAERAPILGHDGGQLSGPVEVVEVGVQPSRITDRPALLAVLQEHLGVDPARVEADLDRRGVQPDWFIPVKRLRDSEYRTVEAAIYPVPGTVFRRVTTRLAVADGLAAHVLGRAGEITAELLEEMGEPYLQHDIVGLSGLERVFEEQLGGMPSGEVQLVDAEGEVVQVVHRFEGIAPTPLQTSIDEGAQRAAEAALDGIDKPAALVAIDPPTGDVRAVASRPVGEFNRALSGRYPPGSTFKIVTAAAALSSGTAADAQFDCPAEVRVGGKRFRNAGGEERGSISFADALVHSCNTVFAPLAADLDRDALTKSARDFGFGKTYGETWPLRVFAGSFPAPGDAAEAAAAGIGQARVEASPLHMASVAAAVSAGGWRPPRLIAADLPPPAELLDPQVAATLRELMEGVVARGTGAAAAVSGRRIAGKTGTAEFDKGDPPPTHAWFIGFDETLAVAVLVEGGGAGGAVAAPIAGRFFADLANVRQ